MKSLDDALWALIEKAPPAPTTEQIAIGQALGRVLAEPVIAGFDVPSFDNSQMDGYAVRRADLQASVSADAFGPLPVSSRIAAGDPSQPLAAGSVARIFTGAPIPDGADAVIMQEQAALQPDGQVVFSVLPAAGDNIRPRAGDLATGQQVLAPGIRLSAADLGLIASVGHAQVMVYKPLRVAVFSSGNELRQPGQALGSGQIYDSNRPMVMGLVAGLGCQVSDLGCLPDKFQVTRDALAAAAQDHDIILTCGGVSVGEEDHIKAAVMDQGELDLWKVAMKPGKPFAYGRIGQASFMGMPGNPVSAWVTFVMLVRPFILKASGVADPIPESVWLEAGFDWPKPDARQEFLRAWIDDEGRVAIHPKQNSQLLSSVSGSRGLVEIPAKTPIQKGDHVRYLGFPGLLG
ncbi:MAG: gephyrin-like molybdotransferase Glp [Burkholderiaceae bacterium]|jgi:molybdopterin molybdotransferase